LSAPVLVSLGLIFGDKAYAEVIETIHHYGDHCVFDVGSPLPKKQSRASKKVTA